MSMQKTVNGENLEMDLSVLPKGIYYLGLTKDGAQEMFKFIKR